MNLDSATCEFEAAIFYIELSFLLNTSIYLNPKQKETDNSLARKFVRSNIYKVNSSIMNPNYKIIESIVNSLFQNVNSSNLTHQYMIDTTRSEMISK